MPGEAIASCEPGTDAIVMLGQALAAGNGAAANGAAGNCDTSNGAAGNGAAACCCINACLPSLYATPVPLILVSLWKYREKNC